MSIAIQNLQRERVMSSLVVPDKGQSFVVDGVTLMKKNWRALVLDRALELIRKGWTKRVLARDARGRDVDIDSSDAKAFCALGAIERAEFELKAPKRVRGDALRCVRTALGSASSRLDVMAFNDRSPNKKRVVALFEKARAQV